MPQSCLDKVILPSPNYRHPHTHTVCFQVPILPLASSEAWCQCLWDYQDFPFPRTTRTWVSGSSEPRLAAPSLTTSASWVMVAAEDWAAWASLSGVDAAPDTSSLVSSTKALAVFRMFSLEGASRWEGRDKGQAWLLTVG